MKLVLVKAGKFLMGAPKDEEDSQRHERPQHEVELSEDFYLGIKPTGKLSFKVANFAGNYPYGTNTKPGPENKSHVRVVGSYPPNALGIYDIHSNLME
jgi:formylglycine-generating enzyme required for sulfatase activity